MTLSQEIKDLYDQGRISTRQMVRVTLGSGVYGFIARREPLDFGGVTYRPFGLLEVSEIGGGTGTAADGGFTLRLAESKDDGLTPAVLTQIENEDYRDRPVVVYDAHFHPDTLALIQIEPVARGYLDIIEHYADDTRGYYLEAKCEGRQLDYSRRNGRKRTLVDQQRRDPGDRFFEHAATAGRVDIAWGRVVGSAVNTAKNAAAGAARAIGFKGL
ncbi:MULTISPECIES: DUF2163 domain-containing protein [unclassified Ensifer]|uniref:DUF2163 domain-containing protein n=1 Tax=unclassified Ensifer TaxID=2633371 RepID=UPI0007151A20|nr:MULTISPECIES: DUF2163 domain-containing protein [unclassified Ensifer]KQX55458.1 hypothetical protein ASD49_25215 [Ensifer sp. Root1298]KQX90950.1 hypothetical protein ASD41_23905 [Ensifer sp. Root1312]KRC25794.1 hypothetical protein ASE29_22365 [Ensifer sp. Root74]KRD73674.1 hypothetical protein ASE71_19690 [Ensifer sp. Root954]